MNVSNGEMSSQSMSAKRRRNQQPRKRQLSKKDHGSKPARKKQVRFDVPMPGPEGDKVSQLRNRKRSTKSPNQNGRLDIFAFLEWPPHTVLDKSQTIRCLLLAYAEKCRTESKAAKTSPADLDDHKTLPIEVILQRLYKLHVMKSDDKPKDTVAAATVERINGIDFDENVVLEVEWTRENNTMNRSVSIFDPQIQHIFESDAYKQFVSTFLKKYRNKMQTLWKKADKETDVCFTDDEALKQIVGQFNFYHFLSFFMLNVLLNEKSKRQSKLLKMVRGKVTEAVQSARYYFKRLQQLDRMSDFEKHINAKDESANLSVENNVDFECVKSTDFKYVNENIAGDGVFISDEPPIGCECTGKSCSIRSRKCKTAHDAPIAYTAERLIKISEGTPVFECNIRCPCSKDCVNRVVQNGRNVPLCIFKTSNGSGWGVRAVNAIAKGEYVCEYVGEVITHKETEKRGKIYKAEGKSYLLDLDFNRKHNPYTIDATESGNVSRFLNHSCDPNLGVYAVWINCLDPDLPKLCFFALRSIDENEELTFDYAKQWPLESDQDTTSQSFIQHTESADVNSDDESMPEVDISIGKQEVEIAEGFSGAYFDCKCGAIDCRKQIKCI